MYIGPDLPSYYGPCGVPQPSSCSHLDPMRSPGKEYHQFFQTKNIIKLVCLFDLILYVPSTIFQLYREGSS